MSELKSMNKVSVTVSLTSDSLDAALSEPVTVSFIYGIGREGLSAFECCLEGGRVGEHKKFSVNGSAVAESFGGLFSFVRSLVDGKIRLNVIKFDIKILGIEEVENREVVAALANSASGCGSGGSCGCGCSS
jgi:hypothetical protein